MSLSSAGRLERDIGSRQMASLDELREYLLLGMKYLVVKEYAVT